MMPRKLNPIEPAKRVRVWDVAVRLFHWSLVASVTATYLFADHRALHRKLGYIVIALIAFRLIWGIIGGPHARFITFVPGPRRLIRYLAAMASGHAPRHLGHNPAGGAMIVALLLTLILITATGYMLGMKAYFGVTWVERTHKTSVNVLLVLVPLHIGGVIWSSLRHRENLVRSMLTGTKDSQDGVET